MLIIGVMIQEREKLTNKSQTAKKMYRLIDLFNGDINQMTVIDAGRKREIRKMNLPQFFDLVRRIRYRRDTKPIEVISRPSHILNLSRLGMDCKKKAILISSFLKSRGIPFRLIGSSNRPNKRIHHVFPQAFFNGEWRNVDATYSHYNLFEPKAVTNVEVLQSY